LGYLLLFICFSFSFNINAAVSEYEQGISVSKSDIDIKRAKKWFNYFYAEGQREFGLAFERGEKYRKTIQLILSNYGIPKDFYYLAMTESYFNNRATSPKSAVGLWQFIPSTAKAYGLIISESIDERRHPVKSTIAAAKYIKDLYNIFQDWTLAAAAYNCGEYRVLRAIKKGETRSFLELSRKKLLPEETINYISKFWVTREIDSKVRNRSYGKDKDKYLNTMPVEFKLDNVSIYQISLISEVEKDEIMALNPDLRSGTTHLSKGVTIYLPKANAFLYNDFIQHKGIISKLQKPDALSALGLKSSKKGDKIKVTFRSNQKIKIKNIRTKIEILIDKKDLSRI